ncbi:MAG: hypothetical protein JXB47_12075 [Anaerolineae bacterium]|nr:hypothetical protein [Anaerolineae bacterium]
MFSLRCFKCGWPINLNRAELETAVAEAMAKDEAHYALVCPSCRRVNKISVKQMRRKLPRDWQPVAQPTEAPAKAKDGEETPAETG